MLENLIGSLTKAVPLLNGASSAASAAPASQPKSGMGGIVDQFVGPLGGVVASALAVASPIKQVVGSVLDTFSGVPVVGSLVKEFTSGHRADGSLVGGLRSEVNILKTVVAGQQMDATAKAKIQGVLDQVKAGKPLNECLSPLSSQEKTLLADTIGNAGFEPPEALSSYLTNKSQGDSSRMDCALKNVEVAEEKGYLATEASTIFGALPLAGIVMGI